MTVITFPIGATLRKFAEVTAASNVASLSVSNIPSNAEFVVFYYRFWNTDTSNDRHLYVQFNDNTGSVYRWCRKAILNGSSIDGEATDLTTLAYIGVASANSPAVGTFVLNPEWGRGVSIMGQARATGVWGVWYQRSDVASERVTKVTFAFNGANIKAGSKVIAYKAI